MKEIKRFQVRGIPGAVTRADFSGRIVDFWAPDGGSDHVLIAHDGQNIFDRKTATSSTPGVLRRPQSESPENQENERH